MKSKYCKNYGSTVNLKSPDFNTNMFKALADYIVQPFLKHYLKKKRSWHYKGLKLVVSPGVFHPGFFFSSQFLADFISTQQLLGKTFCEPGAGSGLISLTAYQKGASVVAYDVHRIAVENIRENFALNFSIPVTSQPFQIYTSDLFDDIPPQTFDYIAVNPPYFFKATTDDASKAWYCGKEGEYFKKIFTQLHAYTKEQSHVYMVLADNCDLDRIQAIAQQNGFQLQQIARKKIWWEVNFIFEVVRVV
ncbi:MAG: methyltransferase small [Chitinophagaceae bacterium]|nr:methyltransferase small [Chitinophagaceae bacterium]